MNFIILIRNDDAAAMKRLQLGRAPISMWFMRATAILSASLVIHTALWLAISFETVNNCQTLSTLYLLVSSTQYVFDLHRRKCILKMRLSILYFL
jgi:hypothetical protein